MTATSRDPTTESVVAVVLAAGLSRRYGAPKQLLPWRGTTLVRHSVATLVAAGITHIAVVVGHAAAAVRAACADASVAYVENAAYATGQASSVVCGVHWAQTHGAARMLVMPCDQPFIAPHHIQALCAAPPAQVSMYQVAGQPCQPSLWAAETYPLLSTLTGDAGGRALIYRGLLTAQYLAADTPALATDIDTPAEYAALCAL
ncbi:MAG: hypothetical protein RLZZ297_75 [Chloroflexota bacterium]